MSYCPDPYRPYAPSVILPPPHRSSTAHLVCAWLAAALTIGYMLPWAIGASRNRPNCVAIALINLFLGWSLIGWIAALILACGSDARPVVITGPPAPPYGQPTYQTYGQQPPYPRPQALDPYPPPYPSYPSYPPPAIPPYGSSASEPTQQLDPYRPPADPR